MPIRLKITDLMVEAAITSIYADAVAAGHSPPDESEAPEQWAEMREVARRALAAAASTISAKGA